MNSAAPQVIIAPVPKRHSEKPDETYRRIEHLYPGPYLELFARKPREGWTTWGDELPPLNMDCRGDEAPALASSGELEAEARSDDSEESGDGSA